MDTEVKKFIEENADLIEKGDFEQFYKKLETERISLGQFTEVFLSAGIDPAEYMREIPSYYLSYYLTGTKIASYTIPQNITSIDWSAFIDCNEFTNVTIPDSVTSIGDYAFGYCEGLTRINFKGTISQWNKIKLDPMWKTDSLQLKEIKCTDGTIIL